jgi:energy-converting hydrogenase Eha subunit A
MESELVRFGIPVIALGLTALFVWGVSVVERNSDAKIRRRRTVLAAGGMGLWLAVVSWLALSGLLGRFDLRPPPMALWFAATLLGPLALALSPYGRRLALALPLGALVGFQAFRLPLELLMHQAAADGIMPVIMSYSGYNFDIVTGITALVLGVAFTRWDVPRSLVIAWNFLGLGLLVVIGTVAFSASPIFLAFGPENVNVWVTSFPYSTMSVMVGAALFGHVLVFRKLYGAPASDAPSALKKALTALGVST